METLITLLDDEFTKITYFDKQSDEVIVSFSSTPRLPSGETEAPEQFIGTISSIGVTGVFVIDKTSSYGNKIDPNLIFETILPIIRGKVVYSVGYCMGGFLAIAMSKILASDAVVAITPQWSIHPDILPADSYLNQFTDKIQKWTIPSLKKSFDKNTRYYVLNSDDADDQHQIKFFPKADNIRVFEFGPAFGHDLPQSLGSKTEDLVLDCLYGYPETVEQTISEYY